MAEEVIIVEKWWKDEGGVAHHQIRYQAYEEQPFEDMLILKDETSDELPYVKMRPKCLT